MNFARFIHRCFDLARLGSGNVSPNPAVGALLMHNDRIIGEGYHQQYGRNHAEVNAVADVAAVDRPLIAASTLFVSLEPCSIQGKTPPCTDLILRMRIPRVVIAQRDLTPGVNGNGLERLRANGVKVIEGVLQEEGRFLSAPRNVYVTQQRPYLLLKWAQNSQGLFARSDRQPTWLTNAFSKRLVHKWRAETDAILIGSGTARADDPALTTRFHPGPSPLRIVVDRQGTLAPSLRLFKDGLPTWWVTGNRSVSHSAQAVDVHQLDMENDWPEHLLQRLYQRKIGHLTIEGGATLLQLFIDKGLWDEARVCTGTKEITEGIAAPTLPVTATDQYRLVDDKLTVYHHPRLQGLDRQIRPLSV